jgi:hypothetical protein
LESLGGEERQDVREVQKLGNLVKAENFGGEKICETREVGRFGRIGRILSPVINVFLQTSCCPQHYSVVLHVFQIHLNINIQRGPKNVLTL